MILDCILQYYNILYHIISKYDMLYFNTYLKNEYDICLFYYILFCSILFYSILFYYITIYYILYYILSVANGGPRQPTAGIIENVNCCGHFGWGLVENNTKEKPP